MKCIVIQTKVGKHWRGSRLHREHVTTAETGFLQTLYHLHWTSYLCDLVTCLGERTPQPCRILPLRRIPQCSVLVSPVPCTALLPPALLSYSSCPWSILGGGLAAVGQKLYAGYQWEGIFVNLLLFNGEIEACQEDKSSRFLPLEQTQFCQPLWQYQGTGSSPQSYKQRRKSPKSCAPNGCAERPFLTPLPPKGKFPFLHPCDFNFLKPPSSPPPWPSSAALVPALLGSVPRRAQPHLPPRSHGISLSPRFCVIHFWDHRCYSKLMDSLRAVQWLA